MTVASRQNRNSEFCFILIASMIRNYTINMQYSNGVTFWYGISLLICDFSETSSLLEISALTMKSQHTCFLNFQIQN